MSFLETAQQAHVVKMCDAGAASLTGVRILECIPWLGAEAIGLAPEPYRGI